jgi:flagellar M-ring protein FliF
MNTAISRFNAYFTSGPRSRQFAVVAVMVAIVCGASLAIWFALRPTYQVLFRDLKRQDAAAITAQLEKEKVPFRYDEKNSAILVPEGDTRAIRLRLMSSDLRLQGAVGFELFNNSDLGLTEFTQKVNYQRALQGELERTIATLDEIDMARVHLALPESSLFKRDRAKPKASVALFMRDGQTLEPDTIRGIQRLVAAAVPEMSPANVSVLNQRGASADTKGGADIDDPQFMLKTAIERRYERKILSQIEPIVGANHASVSVDATIDFDQVRTTRESDVTQPIANIDGGSSSAPALPPSASKSKFGLPPAGLPPLPVAPATEGTRTDRNLEQIVKSPGTIRRLSVGIVVDQPLSAEELAQLNAVVSASIGLDPKRGDALSTFVREAPGAQAAKMVTQDEPAPDSTLRSDEPSDAANARSTVAQTRGSPPLPASVKEWLTSPGSDSVPIATAIAIALAALVATSVWLMKRRTVRQPRLQRLTDAQRVEYVTRLKTLLAQQGTSEGGSHGGH